MISKEYLNQINPNVIPYNPKYSWGTYSFLKKYKNKDIKVYWMKRNSINGKIIEFNKDSDLLFTRIYFCYNINGDFLGTSWRNICYNKYTLYDYTHYDKEWFVDITKWFMNKYLKIGRCMIDTTHINFIINKDHSYVEDEDRFEFIFGMKNCKWCGKIVE